MPVPALRRAGETADGRAGVGALRAVALTPTLSQWEREQTLKKATCVAFLRFISRYVCT